MHLRTFSKKELIPAVWSGGLTYEYVISPLNAEYNTRNFIFRISSATIDQIPSEFTAFKGFHRYLVMLDNTLTVTINGEQQVYQKDEIMQFASCDTVISYSKGTDFNWMISDKIKNHGMKITKEQQNISDSIIILFALSATTVKVMGIEHIIELHDLLVVENNKKEAIQFEFNAECLVGFMNL